MMDNSKLGLFSDNIIEIFIPQKKNKKQTNLVLE